MLQQVRDAFNSHIEWNSSMESQWYQRNNITSYSYQSQSGEEQKMFSIKKKKPAVPFFALLWTKNLQVTFTKEGGCAGNTQVHLAVGVPARGERNIQVDYSSKNINTNLTLEILHYK